MGIKKVKEIMGNGVGRNFKDLFNGKPAEVSLVSWRSRVEGKSVGVDISVLLHALFGGTSAKNAGLFEGMSAERMMLCVDPETSVFYLVAQKLNKWFMERQLFRAKVVVFVHDPKFVKRFHCEECKHVCEKDLGTKYKVTGRLRQATLRKQAAEKWRAAVKKYQDPMTNSIARTAEEIHEATKELRQQLAAYMRNISVVTPSLHRAVAAWASVYNQARQDSLGLHQRDLKPDGKKMSTRQKVNDGAQKKTDIRKNKALWPKIIRTNSPVEADDQLAYLYRTGILDVVLSVDTDLVAMGCTNLVTKGITSLSTSDRAMKGYTPTSLSSRAETLFNQKLNLEDREDKMQFRFFFCLLSCSVGNDYIHGALSPVDAVSVLRKVERSTDEPDGVFVRRVAGIVWSTTLTVKMRKAQTTYGNDTNYAQAYIKAFNIYYYGRHWRFKKIPDIDDFIDGKFELQSSGVNTACDGCSVGVNVFFLPDDTACIEHRMMLNIDSAKFPFPALPNAVLEWWLMTRGQRAEEDNPSQATIEKMVTIAKKTKPWTAAFYKTQYSTILQQMVATSPGIPVVRWASQPSVWKIGRRTQLQDLGPVRTALMDCDLHQGRARGTRKEQSKATTMCGEGQIIWADMQIVQGVNDANMKTAVFSLESIPSMKADPYHVDVVFMSPSPQDAEDQLLLDVDFCFCTCKRGATGKTSGIMCSHRNAALLWLQELKRKWNECLEGLGPIRNFYQLALKLGIPEVYIELASCPLRVSHLEQLTDKAAALHQRSASRKRKRDEPVVAGQYTEFKKMIEDDNKAYLEEALTDECRNTTLDIIGRLRLSHKEGSLDLRKYPQMGNFVFHSMKTDVAKKFFYDKNKEHASV